MDLVAANGGNGGDSGVMKWTPEFEFAGFGVVATSTDN